MGNGTATVALFFNALREEPKEEGMSIDHKAEYEHIKRIAQRYFVDPRFILAIRCAEDGGPGREFGVLSISAPTWDDQCRATCLSVLNAVIRGLDLHVNILQALSDRCKFEYTPSFIRLFAARWAPEDAANDPNQLNNNWARNVSLIYAQLLANRSDYQP